MKPIECRAWNKIDKRMEYFWAGSDDENALDLSWLITQNCITSLMPFIGLTDKNGKKIYDGDILLTPGKFKMVVQIDNIGYGDPKFFNIGFDVCEVIGNIYENPELLK